MNEFFLNDVVLITSGRWSLKKKKIDTPIYKVFWGRISYKEFFKHFLTIYSWNCSVEEHIEIQGNGLVSNKTL